MNEQQFKRYLDESGKFVITVTRVGIRDPANAQRKLDELVSKPWSWWGVVHNCESFVEEIVTAGGGHALHIGHLSLPTNSTNICQGW
jgi:hypothetical protein